MTNRRLFRNCLPLVLVSILFQATKLKLDITHVSGEESEELVNEVLSVSPQVKQNLGFLSSSAK